MLTHELSHFQEQELLIEFSSLSQPNHAPTGLFVSISKSSNRRWDGLLFLHSGPYSGAIFKFEITFDGYPKCPPEVYFLSDVWHPLVLARTGQFCTFPQDTCTVSQLLFHLKAAFKESTLAHLQREDCANRDCFDTYHNSKDLYLNLACQCAKVSTSRPVLYQAEGFESRTIQCIEDDQITYDDMIKGINRYLTISRVA